MTGLVEFLKARLDEDEERARFVQREQGDSPQYEADPWRLSWHDEYDLLCIEPSRALVEVEAKRRILGLCVTETPETGGLPLALRTLRLLALPYADHPEYDESWRS